MPLSFDSIVDSTGSGSSWGWLDDIGSKVGDFAGSLLDFEAADYLNNRYNGASSQNAEQIARQTSNTDLSGPKAQKSGTLPYLLIGGAFVLVAIIAAKRL